MKSTPLARWALLPALILAGLALLSRADERELTINTERREAPKVVVTLKPEKGPPSRYDFEDGSTQCVVRRYTSPKRFCNFTWDVKDADSVSISPVNWSDDSPGRFPSPLPKSGSFRFSPHQFMSGTIRHFTLTATNAGGSTTHHFTIRRYSCFLPGTEVLLADGSYKKIEEIGPGDQVMSYDTEAGKVIAKSVVARTERVEDAGYYVLNKDLKATPNHLFYGNGDWKKTHELKVGDSLLNPNGEPVPIESIERVEVPATVYNLITEGPENYYVRMGGVDVLVHNQKKGEHIPGKGIMPGMQIVLADGRYVPIEQVKVGDRLLSFDKEKKRYTIIRVNGTANQQVTSHLVINGKLKIGSRHPIYVVDPKSNNPGKD